MAAGALWVVPLVALAFAARTVAMLALRKRRPGAAAAVDRWWTWAPFAVVLFLYFGVAIALIVRVPVLGTAITVFGVVVLYFGYFSASSIGSPFRLRRR